ncbi:ribose-5-phosphate isomerase RpiA [Buchnera aphidicola (Taiwanaphis decaspermi)]|uniref:ribose-5-phosphate isomerase RpiA n=1 Tax=Buchnera aphidicola TaxID=9 RepID=UPI0031B7F233
MNQNKLKKIVSKEALKYIVPNSIIGIGTGSTIIKFIKLLKKIKNLIKGAVSSSFISTNYLKKIGIPIININKIDKLSIYIDSADEINNDLEMIKGGGGALTKEKIIAASAQKFLCIVDESKYVKKLGKFPLPIEIIPMSCSYVVSEITKLGGYPKIRNNFITENYNKIIDVYNFNIINPSILENKINNIPGVVTVGIFTKDCSADIALISTTNLGIIKIKKK